MSSDPRADPALPLDVVHRVEDVCVIFEDKWRGGARPVIEELLGESTGLERAILLRELLAVEVECRRLAGERPAVAEYIERFPADRTLVDLIVREAKGIASGCEETIDTQPSESRGDLPPVHGLPRVFGDYELLAEIARGGMGVVYKARQLSLNRTVAVKMILAGQLASAADVERFKAEAQAAAQLDHSSIVPIIEVGELEGHRFFSMGFVDGLSLAQRLADRPLPPREAGELLLSVAEAVQYAHERGVVHRDLKPANILCDSDGRPRIADFGLAKRVNENSGLTATGQIIGTPSYMPPEQATGKVDLVGPLSDVYSLGAVLYAALTGRPPFQAASTLDTLKQVLEREPIPPSRLDPTVPRDLDTITLKCLEKIAARRYPSAQALANELRRYLAGEPILARPVGPAERAQRWCRRNPVVAALAAVVMSLVVALGIGAIVANATLRTSLERAESAETAAVTSLGKLQVSEAETTEQLWHSLIAQAHAGRWSRQIGQHFDSLTALEKAARIARDSTMPAERIVELRDEVAACAALVDVRRLRTWNNHTPRTYTVGADSTLDRYATSDGVGNLTVRSLEDDTELFRIVNPANLPGVRTLAQMTRRPVFVGRPGYVNLKFSPTGRFLAAWYLGPSLVYDLKFPSRFATCGFDFHCRFSAQGETVYTIRADGSLEQYDPITGDRLHSVSLPVPRTQIQDFCLHPDGRRAAYGDVTEKSVQIIDLETGAIIDRLPQPATPGSLVWHPDGHLLAVAQDERVLLWNVEQHRQVAALEGHQGLVIWTLFSPSGSLLATASWDDTTRIWSGHDGREILQLPGGIMQLNEERGRLAAQEGTESSLYELVDGRMCRSLPGSAWGIEFAPDGCALAVAGQEGVDFWDAATGQRQGRLPIGFTETATFKPKSGNPLMTFSRGATGLQRWPVVDTDVPADRASESPAERSRRIGPPTRLPVGADIDSRRAAWSLDGGTFLVSNSLQSELLVFKSDDLNPRRVPTGAHISTVAISPEGRWAVASYGRGGVARVWNLDEDGPTHDFPLRADAHSMAFSPDSKWLVINQDDSAYYFFHVGTWEPGPVIEHRHRSATNRPPAFSGDGRLLALIDGDAEVLLLDAATLEKLVTLHAPAARLINAFAFNADSSLLAVACREYGTQVWDLAALRTLYASMGIDWPHAPAASPKPKTPPVLRVEVVMPPDPPQPASGAKGG